MNCFAIAEKVKQMDPRVNIIFVTVCEERDCAKDFMRLRASGSIRKPYEARELAEKTFRILAEAEACIRKVDGNCRVIRK